MSSTPKVLLAAAALAMASAPASAQDNVLANDVTAANTTADPALNDTTNTLGDPMSDPLATDPMLNDTTNTYAPAPKEDDDDLPWGLLGLLGLAGLMGRKKHDTDIHVDNRSDRSKL